MSADNEAEILALIGSTGSGKSLYSKQLLNAAKPARLLVWDPKWEYHRQAHLIGKHGLAWCVRADLPTIAKRRKDARYAFSFTPGKDHLGRPVVGYTAKQREQEFDLFCDLCIDAGNLTVMVDELSNVTSASWSPDPWMNVSCEGRHAGLTVIGASQRPAHIDKDFLGNATRIHVGMLGEPDDAKAVARRIPDVTERQLLDLRPLQWIDYDKKTHQLTTGTLKIPRSRKR